MAGPSNFVDLITSRIGSFIGLNGSLPQRKTAGFNIDEFKSSLNTRGVLPTNLFLVSIYPKKYQVTNLMNREGFNPQSLTLFCMKADLPGINLGIESNIPQGIGPLEAFPTSAVFGDLSLDFIGDAKGNIMSFFHNWINYIVPYNGTKAYDSYHKLEYKDNFSATIEITVFNQQSDQVLIYTLLDTFPFVVNQIPMSWAEQNSMMTISIGFSYNSWHSNRILINDLTDQSGSLSFIQKVIKAGSIVQTLSALKKPQSIGDTINLVNNANIIGSNLTGFF